MKKNNKKTLSKLINQEEKRQKKSLNLIASENITSKNIIKANGSVLINKYAEGLPEKRYYGGCNIIDIIESIGIERLKKIFKTTYANIQPHSGSQANLGLMFSILKPKDKILGFQLSHGGHLSHGSSINFSGKLYKSIFYGIDKKTKIINWKKIEKIAKKQKPKLIILGASSYSRDWNYKKIKKISNDIGAFVMTDISHTAGLILKKILNNPTLYCHFITSTTHKTLKGPRGGIITINKDFIYKIKNKFNNISYIINKSIFPGIQGGPFENIIAAKAIAFKEVLNKKYLKNMLNIKKNTKKIIKLFIKKKYNVLTNGTNNHIVLINLKNKKINGKIAENSLSKADIIVNKNAIPFDNKSNNITSGIRIGTGYITSIGVKLKEMDKMVEFIDKILTNYQNEKIIKKIKKKINQWMNEKYLKI